MSGHPCCYDVIRLNDTFALARNGTPVRTPAGREVVFPTPRLPEHILHELLFAGADSNRLQVILGYFDEWAQTRERYAADPAALPDHPVYRADPLIDKKAFERMLNKQTDAAQWVGLMESPQQGALLFDGLANAVRTFNQWMIDLSEGRMSLASRQAAQVADYMASEYRGLDAAGRTLVRILCASHGAGYALPLMLFKRRLCAAEYVNAIFGLHAPQDAGHTSNDDWFRLQLDMPPSFAARLPDWEAMIRSRLAWLDEVRALLDFAICAQLHHAQGSNIAAMLRSGESFQVEFKASLRWNIRAGKKDPAIEHAALKTINAFLNSSGGSLLIGVHDDGSVAGLALDRFESEDKFALHFWNLVKSQMGQQSAPFIQAEFADVKETRIFHVHCSPSPRPVFLKPKGGDEEFYIRVGPSSARLSVSEVLSYMNSRFGSRELPV